MKKEEYYALLKKWIQEQRLQELAESTLTNYEQIIERFIDWLPDEEDLSKELLMQFKLHLEEILGSTSTRNHNLVVVDKFLKWLGQQECCVKLFRVQSKQSNGEVISKADYGRLLRMANKKKDHQLFWIMQILATTGIRVAELEFFTVENLDFTIDVTNKGKERKIFVRQDLKRGLEHYCKEQGITKGYIFPSPIDKSQMVSKVTIWRHMKKLAGACRGIDLKKVHAHSFRHLFAQTFMDEYGNLALLSDILGHTSLETTRRYTMNSDTDKRHMLEGLKFTK